MIANKNENENENGNGNAKQSGDIGRKTRQQFQCEGLKHVFSFHDLMKGKLKGMVVSLSPLD